MEGRPIAHNDFVLIHSTCSSSFGTHRHYIEFKEYTEEFRNPELFECWAETTEKGFRVLTLANDDIVRFVCKKYSIPVPIHFKKQKQDWTSPSVVIHCRCHERPGVKDCFHFVRFPDSSRRLMSHKTIQKTLKKLLVSPVDYHKWKQDAEMFIVVRQEKKKDLYDLAQGKF